jgi:hypothetical protein
VKPEPYSLVPIRATSVRHFAVAWTVTLLVCVPVFAITSVLWVTYNRSADAAWIDFMYRQKDMMLDRRAAQGHRLIIVGGSNALFGIDGELIERKLHVPTVNFGMHAGLGLNYMLYRASKKMQSGDTILLDPEYDVWSDTYRDSPGPAFHYFFTYDKWYLAHMPVREAAGIIASVPLADWKDGSRRKYEYKHLEVLQGYNIGTLSPSGDMRTLVPFHPQPTDCYPFIREPSAGGFMGLRSFAAEAKAKGVKVLMTWPNYMRPNVDLPPQLKTPPDWFAVQMAEDGVTVLNKPTDTAFPREWFMDSSYHTNPCCRRVRTEELIQLLRPQLGLPPAPKKATGIFLVAGYDHRLTEGNLFADDPGVRFRYLRMEDPTGLPALTPAQVAKLVEEGMPVYTDSEEAGTLLAKAGLVEQLDAVGKVPIAQWFGRYPAHIFCLATPPDHRFDPVWKSLVPAPVYNHLCVDRPSAMVFGSGRFAPFKYIVTRPTKAYLMAELPRLFRDKSMMPTNVQACAWARDGGGPLAKIWVDWGEVLTSTRGISVSVIDPGIGAVIETVTFGEGPELQTWRRFRVAASKSVGARPATRP